jgi:hypothetical protein
LSRSALKDTGVPAPMETMMVGSLEDICLFACSPQSYRGTWRPRSYPEPGAGARAMGTRGGPGAAPGRGDMWRPRSCPQPGGGSRCLDLKLICGGTRSSGCRQRPSGPPRERLRTRRWCQFFGTPLGYLDLFTGQTTVGPREVPELEVQERPPSTLRNIVGGPEVPELKVRERPPST